MTESFPPGRESALDLFNAMRNRAERLTEQPPTFADYERRIRLERLAGGDRNICRWCLEPFDFEQTKPRTIWERGQLRTRLKMADDGTELSICDTCWDVVNYPHFTMGGRPQSTNPEEIPNLLLRRATEG